MKIENRCKEERKNKWKKEIKKYYIVIHIVIYIYIYENWIYSYKYIYIHIYIESLKTQIIIYRYNIKT